MINLGGGIEVNHLEFYCAICDEFINHINVKPYEASE